MKTIQELPKNYRGLALVRRAQHGGSSNNLIDYRCFPWSQTPEGSEFWDKVYKADGHNQLPEFPEGQKNTVELWNTIKLARDIAEFEDEYEIMEVLEEQLDRLHNKHKPNNP